MRPTIDDSTTTVPDDEHDRSRIWRASDADREAVARVVQQGLTSGMLTVIEAEERLTAVYGARLRHELDPITADLPIVRQSASGERSVHLLVRVDQWVHHLMSTEVSDVASIRALPAGHRILALALALLAATVCVMMLLFGADFVSD